MLLLLIEILLILTNFTLVAIVYKGQKTLVARLRLLEISFMAFVSSIGVWVIIQSLYDYVTKPSQSLLMQHLIDLGLMVNILMVLFFWIFMTQFAKQNIKKRVYIIHFTLAIIVCLVGLVIKPVYTDVDKGVLVFAYRPVLYSVYTVYLLAYFADGLKYLALGKYTQKSHVLQRSRRNLIIGFVLSLALIVFGNVALPILYDKTSDGFIDAAGKIFFALGATLISFSAAFSVFNLGVFNLRKFLFRSTLAVFSYLVPALGFIYLMSFGLSNLIGINSLNLGSIQGRVLYVVSVIVGVSVIFVSKKYVSIWVSRAFSGNRFTNQDFAIAVENLIKSEFSDKLTAKFAKLCKDFLGADKVIIFVGGRADSDMATLKSIGSSKSSHDTDSDITQLYGEIEIHSKKKDKFNNFIEDIKLLNDADINYLLGYEQAQLHGAIFLGSKLNGQRYYMDEAVALRKALIEILLAMQNIFRLRQLVEFNKSLESKIEIATKELRHTNDKLRALDEAKDEFISMASHQLRTPLTSIKGYISLILDGDMGKVPIKQRKMLSEAFSSSQRMVYLISDLLNVSRLKTGKFVIEAVDVYLPDVVEEEIDQVREMAEGKNIKIHYEKPKTFAILQLDDMKIRQVIMNFIDNAIHYTPENGKITVELVENQKSIDFKVSDSGIGVPKSEQHHLFTKFYRAGNARKARPDGTGLGLFMAKKVIMASGGSILFRSTEGEGSTFGFCFPKK